MFDVVSVLNDPLARVTATLDVGIKEWPVVPPKRLSDTIVQNLGPLFFFSSIMILFLDVINLIVYEKESKIRYSMELVGLIPSIYWLGHFLSSTMLCFFTSLWMIILGLLFRFESFTQSSFLVSVVNFRFSFLHSSFLERL